MPGVRAIITGDSPGAKLPFYFTPKGPLSWLFDPHCRHEGEEVAAVAAETLREARAAAKAIEVEYEELPFVVDFEKALDPGAPAAPRGRQPRRRAREARARRRGEGLRGGGGGRRDDVPHAVRDPHADGDSRLGREVGGRPADHPRHEPGRLRPALGVRAVLPAAARQRARRQHLHGRRLRQQARARQVHAGGGAAVAADRPAGQAASSRARRTSSASATARPTC